MKDYIKHALTKTIEIRTAHVETQQLEITPDKKLLYGMYFALPAFIMHAVGFGKRRRYSNVFVSKPRVPTTFKLPDAGRQ
jgi:hypothetical protein